jgi:thymidine kinase
MSLEVIVGCMYSGKTEELVRRLRRAEIAGQRVRAFKAAIDTRYAQNEIATHVGGTFSSSPVRSAMAIRHFLGGALMPEVIGFDEAQFMEPEIIPLLESYADIGIRVIVAGLDQDYLGKPFGPIPHLMAVADQVTKLQAVCVAPHPDQKVCGEPATRSYRVPDADSGEQVQVGSNGVYEARCRPCWIRGQP